MPAADQEQIARVYIGGFLAASLQGRDEYRALFTTPAAGRDWLPDQTVLVRSSEGGFRPLLDPSRLGNRLVAGVTDTERDLSLVSIDLVLRALQDSQLNRVDALRWKDGSGTAEYRLDLPPSTTAALTGGHTLRFAMADGRAEGAPGTIDPQIVLRTRDGGEVARRLSEWGDLAPPLPAAMYKEVGLASAFGIGPDLRSPVERVLQTWALPLADFTATDPAFDPARIASVSFVFDRAQAGVVYLDEVGFGAP